MINPGDLCICGHTYEVHFGANCSGVGCSCREFALGDAGIEIYEALKAAQQEFLSLSSYLATCDPVIIIQNLDSTIASLRAKQAMAEAAIRKAKGE